MHGMRKIERKVTLCGVTPIMFDRYSGNNKEQLAVMDKLYVDDKDNLVIPSINILSFLSSQNTESAPQRLIGRGHKAVCKAALSFVSINPYNIPITREGEPLNLENADVKIHYAVARVKKGALSVPNPKERPYIETPWEISFNLTLLETPELNENLLMKIFESGGMAIGLGTFRGVFGKFCIKEWE